MERTCLKCGVESTVSDDPLAECPSCGAIYSRVEEAEQLKKDEARAQEALIAKKAAQKALAEQKRRDAAAAYRASHVAAPRAAPTRRKWLTPDVALIVFVLYAIPIVITAIATMGVTNGMSLGFGLVALAVGWVLKEAAQVLFHIATTLESVLEELRKAREASPK